MSKLKDHGCTINEHITSLDGNSCECGYFTHQLIQAHTNAEIAKVLDRLEEAKPNREDFDDYNGEFLMSMYAFTIDKAIKAERAKLKEVK